MIHWVLNDNTCALTLFEKKIREEMYGYVPDSQDCFTCRLIEPIYDFKANNHDSSTIIYIITLSLWALSVGKLFYKWKTGDIVSFADLFKPFN